jgi:YgiT-type zinc finger domain-containing protein
MGMVLTRCPSCGRRGITKKRVQRTYEIGGARRVVRGVEAQVCPHCGATFLDLDAIQQVDHALNLGRARRRRSA